MMTRSFTLLSNSAPFLAMSSTYNDLTTKLLLDLLIWMKVQPLEITISIPIHWRVVEIIIDQTCPQISCLWSFLVDCHLHPFEIGICTPIWRDFRSKLAITARERLNYDKIHNKREKLFVLGRILLCVPFCNKLSLISTMSLPLQFRNWYVLK